MSERPATLVDDVVIFEDGAARTLTPEELELRDQGKLIRVQRAEATHGPYGTNWSPLMEWELRRLYG